MIASAARGAGLPMLIGFGSASLIGQAPQPQFQPRQPGFDRMLDPFHAEMHPSTT